MLEINHVSCITKEKCLCLLFIDLQIYTLRNKNANLNHKGFFAWSPYEIAFWFLVEPFVKVILGGLSEIYD